MSFIVCAILYVYSIVYEQEQENYLKRCDYDNHSTRVTLYQTIILIQLQQSRGATRIDPDPKLHAQQLRMITMNTRKESMSTTCFDNYIQ